jgi:hypothetical protein
MWITYIFEKAILQEEMTESNWFTERLVEGHWKKPFPNQSEDCQAFGLEELFAQSENGFAFYAEAGNLLEIVCTNHRPIHFILDKAWVPDDDSMFLHRKAIFA